ncbi:MAG: excinuclease ABC subunit A, partial [Patescibacteria group bacterium]
MGDIIIQGAREHNLKDVNVTIPKDKFVVITGLSGSGKSSLAFDTLYAEGQRRYVESLSSYARQFLGVMNKPDVDSIEGLSPAISIEQKTTSKNPRSTVGTVTEIYDYLRLLFARIGTPFCPEHNIPISSQTPKEIQNRIQAKFKEDVIIMSPVIRQKKGTYEQLLKDLNKAGYTRARVNGKVYRTDERVELSRYKKHDIDVIIDKVPKEDPNRLVEAIEKASHMSNGLIMATDNKEEEIYSSQMSCPECGISFEELQPRMFSFNSPFGACEECHGLGEKIEFDPDLIIPDKSLTILDGAVKVYGKMDNSWRMQQLGVIGKYCGFKTTVPVNKFKPESFHALLYGSDKSMEGMWSNGARMHFPEGWEGLIPQQERLYRDTSSDYRKRELERYMQKRPCPVCHGKRLKDKILAVRINEKNIIETTSMSIDKAATFFNNLELTEKQTKIAHQILKEIRERLSFLNNVGLSYLSLSRSAGTLSGGEAQRIRLATQIGSNLTGVLYVLDEPSIGLHQRDNNRLIETLHKLRDLGNTLVVVEHDEDTIMHADYVIDIGPGAGIHGGKIIAEGTPKELAKNKNSLTGQYLAGKEFIDIPKEKRRKWLPIKLKGCRANNLKDIDVEIPTRCMTLVTGVSGSGKSTLINQILYKGMMKKLHDSKEKPGDHDEIQTASNIDKVIIIDQSPIGRTPRSNPSTYTGMFDEVRRLFSETKESRIRGYMPGRFSFNVKGGRCEKCQGDGTIKIEMNFLPDVYVECEECKGTRFNDETLQIKVKDKSIAEVLDMSVEEAIPIFRNIPSIAKKLETLKAVGLEYIKLGQSSTTLSGGESQRIKLTKELAKRSTGKTLYILDEPTTGLHFHDVKKLIEVLNTLVDKGNTMVIIEHNLDVIKCADHIIDLGPEGGEG